MTKLLESINNFVHDLENAKEANDVERILDILKEVELTTMNTTILKTTQIARIVGKLR